MPTIELGHEHEYQLSRPLVAVLLLAFVQWQAGMIVCLLQALEVLAATAAFADSERALIRVLSAASLGVVATVLLVGQRNDLRASYLGALFMVSASAFGLQPLTDLVGEAPESQFSLLQLLVLVPPEALSAYCAWRFAALFPNAVDTPKMRLALRVGTTTALFGGLLLFVANVVGGVSRPVWFRLVDHRAGDSLLQWFSMGMSLLAMAIAAARFRNAAQRDRARARLLAVPLLLVVGLVLLSSATILIHWGIASEVAMPMLRFAAWLSLPLVVVLPPSLAIAITNERALNVRLFAPRLAWALVRQGVPLGLLVGAVLMFVLTLLGGSPLGLLANSNSEGPSSGRELGLLLWFGLSLVAVGALFAARSRSEGGGNRSAETGAASGAIARLRAVEAPHQWHQWLTDLAGAFGATSSELIVVSDKVPDALAPTREGARELRSLFALRSGAIDLEGAGLLEGVAALPGAVRERLERNNTAILQPVFGTAGEPLAVLCVGGREDQRAFDAGAFAKIDLVASAMGLFLERKVLEGTVIADGGAARRDDGGTLDAVQCPICDRVFASSVVECSECSTETRAAQTFAIEEPLIVAGKFQLKRAIGAGALGKVYAAHDAVLDRRVAIKVVPGGSPAGLRVLTREARAIAALDNPRLARVHVAEPDGQRLFVVSEFLEGGTLKEQFGVRRGEDVVDLGVQLLAALLPLHERDLVHGDIKPSNIGFDANGHLKLLDFGMVRMLDEIALPGTPERAGLRASTMLPSGHVGTPLYSPPEAWRGEPVGTAADLWPVAVVLWELLTGVHPFEREVEGAAETVAEIRRAILRAELQPTPEGIKESPKLVKILVRALDLEPGRRFVDVHAFKNALELL